MKPIELIFGTYNGLPLGSTDVEFEHAYERAYKPFLTTLYKFPGLAAAIYYSGILLSWLHEHHPEFLMLLNDMVKRKQIELLGGAFYEPILPLIPSSDRSGQIEMLTTYLRKRFGKRPRGFWLPQLIWEPSLPASLKNCGMEYSFLDADAFDEAGIASRDQCCPVLTEDQGKPLTVYPVQKRLAPSRLPKSERLDHDSFLKNLLAGCSGGDGVLTVFDQGEALGLWDDSFGWLYEEANWLHGLFERLSSPDAPVVTVLPKASSRRPQRAQRCYFGCSSASSLTDWWYQGDSERKEEDKRIRRRAKQLLPNGTFRQIIGRYPESGNLYSKMMHVYVLVNQIRGDRYRKRAAREELWKGQSGYALYHDGNDGIRRNGIRKAAYEALIEAEKIARERGIFKPYTSREDFDMDGLDEYLCTGNTLNVYLHRVGGAIFELDYLPAAWNYLDTMGNYEEPYHGSLLPTTKFDSSPKRGFVDRLVAPEMDFDHFVQEEGTSEDVVELFREAYEVIDYKRDHMEVAFQIVWAEVLELQKRFILQKNLLTVEYRCTNRSVEQPVRTSLLSEMNFSFASNNEEFLQVRASTGSGDTLTIRDACASMGVTGFVARDLKNAVTIDTSFSAPVEFWSIPVVSQWYSRNGSRIGYQGSTFVARSELELEPGATTQLTIAIEFNG